MALTQRRWGRSIHELEQCRGSRHREEHQLFCRDRVRPRSRYALDHQGFFEYFPAMTQQNILLC
jgi:hypothetical protein